MGLTLINPAFWILIGACAIYILVDISPRFGDIGDRIAKFFKSAFWEDPKRDDEDRDA